MVVGAEGMLGHAVLDRLARGGRAAVGLGRRSLDITKASAVRRAVHTHRPAVVVNCAAWTAVDDAESHEDEAFLVNGRGPAHLAAACAASGARLLHISTDYVFSGVADTPYAEDHKPDPRTAYGRGKLAGERAVLTLLPRTGYVIRTGWLYGAGGGNFVRTIIRMERSTSTLEVVNDQRGQPTWAADLADLLVLLGEAAVLGTAPAGVFHGTSRGETTWFELARETFRLLGADPLRVRPVDSSSHPRPARRPAYSVLGHHRLESAGLPPIRPWRDALTEALPELVAAEHGLRPQRG
ncbi:dTDP-4-dehydrorhamnose reductase [Streptomyces sp. NPDC048483]|uniref:dTDP-4-dehydrorhamnose reductase n=1 Tax=Streptomyces sp. NPDC048483 TaxID=3154927 RepID=UPI00342C7C16